MTKTNKNKLKERVFKKLFEAAEIAKFTPEEVEDYEKSLKYYRDLKNAVDSSKKEGKREVTLAMKKKDIQMNKSIN